MSQALLKHVQESSKSVKAKVQLVRAGNRVKVHQRIMEATKDGFKERIQIFEGLVIAVGSGHGNSKTFTVRKLSYGIGVEKIFPFHSPNISKVEIMGESKVSRSKLYFMRERTGKSARLKDKKGITVTLEDKEQAPEEVTEEVIAEAVEAAKKEEMAKVTVETEEEVTADVQDEKAEKENA
jgi:large subunit ribosomal protein L19